MMYVDPNGEWFFTAILSAFGPLGTLAGAALDGGMMSAAINVGAQLVMTGQVNWSSVGNSFASGALSAGLSFGVGEMGQAMGMGGDLAFKTVAHGISGGIQSAAFGGDFGSGFLGGGAGVMAGSMVAGQTGWFERAGVAGLASGSVNLATGGNFWGGFQQGAYQQLFNDAAHEMLSGEQVKGKNNNDNNGMDPQAKRAANKYGPDALGILGSTLQLVPNPVAKVIGGGLSGMGALWNGYSVYKEPTAVGAVLGIRGLYSPHPIFGLTTGSASLLYNYVNP